MTRFFRITTFFLFIHLHFHQAACQYQRDYAVFTAHLICDLPGNNIFRYKIEYFEEDFFTANDKITRYDSVGTGIDGEAIDNNFGVMYGDGFLDTEYEMFAMVLHNCTRNPKKMREHRVDLGTCSTETGGCKFSFELNITNLGREVVRPAIEDNRYFFDDSK